MLNRKRGFTLIEIMIALLLSSILMAGAVQVFTASKQSYRLNDNLARMQESGRFAMDLLGRELRMAGFMPCKLTGKVANTLNGGSNWNLNFFGGALVGFDGSASTFPSGIPATGSDPGDRVAGTDAVVVLRGGDENYSVTQHNPTSAQFKLNDNHTLVDNDVVLVCDGTNAAIFQVTNVNSSNVTVVHNTGTGSPGNCSKSIGGNGSCDDPSGLEAHAYGGDSQLIKFEANAYYIGVSRTGTSRSLYRMHYTATSNALSAEELVEGVENMQLVYGVDSDADNQIERYVSANDVSDWNRVLAARVAMLVHTPEEVADVADSTTYDLVGTSIGTSTSPSHASDRRLRYVFSSTVQVRNRGL